MGPVPFNGIVYVPEHTHAGQTTGIQPNVTKEWRQYLNTSENREGEIIYWGGNAPLIGSVGCNDQRSLHENE